MRAHTAALLGALSLSIGGVATVGCAGARVKAEKAAADLLVSDQQEEQLGAQIHQQLVKEGMRFSQDPEVNVYVKGLASKVIAQGRKDRKNVDWQVFVIDDPKMVNAFVTPGGRMYVFTGLLLEADSEAEVLGVLAHETGHVVGRHAARQMVNQFGLQTLAGLALGENPSMLAQLGASIVGTGTLLAHSRSEETEADEYGARYAHGAGYDPRGLITFFQKLLQQSGKTPGVMTWLSTHPATEDRISHLRQYIARNNLRGGQADGGKLAQVQQRLTQGVGGSGTPSR